MKMLLKSRWHSCIIVVLGMLALSACVNEDYDLSKELDIEMTILKNVSLPFGDVEKISIGDILTLEDAESMISKNEDGDYIFSFGGDEISVDVEIPSFSVFPAEGIHTEPIEIIFPTGLAAGKTPDIIKDDIVYSKIAGKEIAADMDIEISSELPVQITGLKSVGLNASIRFNFSAEAGSFHLKEGFVLDFPDYLHLLQSNYSDTRFELVDNHKLILKEDIWISSSSPLVCDLQLDRINIPSSAIVDGTLVLNESVKVSGDFYLSPSDYDVIPDEIAINIKADIVDLDVLSAEVKLALDEKIEGTTIDIGDIPDFISGTNVCLDLYNPAFRLDFDNASPFSFNVKAGLTGKNDTREVSFSLGDDPAINIPAESTSRYVISRRGYPEEAGVTNIVVSEIGDMISMLPKTVSIDDITFTSTDTDYVEIYAGTQYKASIGYEVCAPFAFDKDLVLSFSQDIEDLGVDLAVGVPSVEASLKIENSVPLEFTVMAEALDQSGKVRNDIDAIVNKTIPAGSHKSPATTDISLSIKSKGGSISFDGLRLTMKASSSAETAGVTLNENQGFAIKNLVITLPKGITFTEIENE